MRGDAGYGVPWMYAVCERLGLIYTFGLTANAVYIARSRVLKRLRRELAGMLD